MTVPFQKGRYGVRLAVTPTDLAACRSLRQRAFRGRAGQDRDSHDALCRHLMIASGADLVGTFRARVFAEPAGVTTGYTARFYDLSQLTRHARPMIEIGRFCTADHACDADVVRLAWAAMAQMVIAERAGLLFGCTSFAGTSPARYADAFGWLAARQNGSAAPIHALCEQDRFPLRRAFDPDAALRQMPPLLRSYLRLGGWTGEHGVIDRDMDTIHVFTALEVDRIPPRRAAALRALAG